MGVPVAGLPAGALPAGALPVGTVVGVMADNLRLRGSVLPIPARAVTRWARGLDIPRGGSTVLLTGQMYQLVPYIELAVRAMRRLGGTRLASLAPLGRRVNRMVNATGLVLRPAATARAPYERVLVDVATLLRGAGVEFGYLYGDDPYSGALAHDLGLDRAVAAHARRVAATLRRYGVREVITVDPHTTAMLRDVYPAVVDGFDVRVRSYLEVLADEGPAPARSLDVDLVVHDACGYARSGVVLEQPRRLLAAAGVRVREPAHTGRLTWCCGGPAESLFPDTARAVARERVEQLRRAAAPATARCATMCPLCLVNLRSAAGDRMAFDDISHHLRQAYPPAPPPTGKVT